MSNENENLIFNPDNKNFGGDKYRPPAVKSKLSEWLIKLSGGKLDETKANYVMLVMLGVIILATIIVVYSSFSGGGAPKNIPVAVPNEAAGAR